MKKHHIVGLVITIVLIVGIVYADQMVFSTYYPAPYGRYRQFSTTGLTTLATDEFGNEGVTAVVGIGTTNPDYMLTVQESSSNKGKLLKFNRENDGNAMFAMTYGVAGPYSMNYEGLAAPVGNETTPIHTFTTYNAANDTLMERLAILKNGKIGIGTAELADRAKLEVATHGMLGGTRIYTTSYGGSSGGFFIGRRTKGSQSLPTAVTSGQHLASFEAEGYAGSDFERGGYIRFNAAENWTDSAQGTTMSVRITEKGTSSPRTRMHLSDIGNLSIGTAPPTTDANPNGDITGNLDVADVWLRGADGGTGAWASESGGGGFGNRTDRDSANNPLAIDTIYRVTSDGFVSYTAEGNYGPLYFYSDANPIPSTVLSEVDGDYGRGVFTICLPVISGHYWKIEKQGGWPMTISRIKWVPIGAGVCIKQ